MMTTDSTRPVDGLPSLTINDDQISWTEVLGSMLLFGKLKPFLREYVSQYVLIQEINQREDLDIDSAELMQAIMDFRLQRQLNDQPQFEEWLQSENLDNKTFQQRIVLELKVKKLRGQIAASQLQPYFEENQSTLDQVHLSCLLVSEPELAQRIFEQLKENESDFMQVATQYSAQNPTQSVQSVTRQAQRRSLTPELRQWVETASIGSLFGPIEVGGNWCIVRLIEITPAQLDDSLQQQLEAQLFGQWMVDQVQSLNIGFQANSNPLPEE